MVARISDEKVINTRAIALIHTYFKLEARITACRAFCRNTLPCGSVCALDLVWVNPPVVTHSSRLWTVASQNLPIGVRIVPPVRTDNLGDDWLGVLVENGQWMAACGPSHVVEKDDSIFRAPHLPLGAQVSNSLLAKRMKGRKVVAKVHVDFPQAYKKKKGI